MVASVQEYGGEVGGEGERQVGPIAQIPGRTGGIDVSEDQEHGRPHPAIEDGGLAALLQ